MKSLFFCRSEASSFPCLPPLLVAGVAALFAPAVQGAPPASPQYTVTVLGTLNNPGSSAVVRRVNSLGEVVGGYKNTVSNQASAAFLLSGAGFDAITEQQVTDFSASYGINDSGEIAGIINGPTAVLPFRAIRHTGFQLLPLLDEDTSGGAFGINDKGETVGFSSGAGGVRAAWWTRQGKVTGLPGLQGMQSTRALDINSRGDIVGYAGEGSLTAVLWPDKGGIIPLDTPATYTSSEADSINDKGDMVGLATAYDETTVRMHAVLWSAGTINPRDLGTLSGGTTSRARDIDDNDNVVGTSDSPIGNHAFLWTPAAGMQDLNAFSTDAAIVLVDAMSISKQGVILAVGINKSDYPSGDVQDLEEHELPRQVVLLTPTK